MVMLIAAKTRIAPANAIKLQSLKLWSAFLLSELIHVIRDALPDTVYETYLWTYSTIALSYILKSSAKGNQFQLHRANKITDFTFTEM